jgi:hypothetical protein
MEGESPLGEFLRAGRHATTADRLDELLAARGMTLTELSHRVEVTIANLSILKTGKGKAIRSPRWHGCARCSAASPATFSATPPKSTLRGS